MHLSGRAAYVPAFANRLENAPGAAFSLGRARNASLVSSSCCSSRARAERSPLALSADRPLGHAACRWKSVPGSGCWWNRLGQARPDGAGCGSGCL